MRAMRSLSAILLLPLSIVLTVVTTGLSGWAAAAEFSRPLYARPATTSTSFYLDAFFEYFDGLALQEATELEGWTAGLDMTFPFRPNMQLRFLLPARTEAEGVLVNGGGEIDIEGWGGTFDFATLYFEHQVIGVDGGANRVSYFAGFGTRTGVLETGTQDKYNHRGRSWHAGLRYDQILDSGGLWLIDTEIRFYEESDDLHPGNLRDDTFWLATMSTAWLGTRRGVLTPALEVTADVAENFFAASLVPEALVRGSEALELKFGLPIGLTSDAPDWGAQFRLTLSF